MVASTNRKSAVELAMVKMVPRLLAAEKDFDHADREFRRFTATHDEVVPALRVF
jgi:hypothetical protein